MSTLQHVIMSINLPLLSTPLFCERFMSDHRLSNAAGKSGLTARPHAHTPALRIIK